MTGLAVTKMSLFLTVTLSHFGRVLPLAEFETQQSLNNAFHSIRTFRSSVISAAYISGARFIWYASMKKTV